jgi:hypothetical protein
MALAADTCKSAFEAARVAGLLVGMGELVAARVAVRAIVGVRVGVEEGDDFGWGVGAGVLTDGSLISACSTGDGSDADGYDDGAKTRVTARGIAPPYIHTRLSASSTKRITHCFFLNDESDGTVYPWGKQHFLSDSQLIISKQRCQ